MSSSICDQDAQSHETVIPDPCAHKLVCPLSSVHSLQSVRGDVSPGESKRNDADGPHTATLIKTLVKVSVNQIPLVGRVRLAVNA